MFQNMKEFCSSLREKYRSRAVFWYCEGDRQVEITYNRFLNDVGQVQRHFENLGIYGKKVCLREKNSYMWLVSFFAVVLSGNIAVLVDEGLKEDEAEARLRTVQCGYLMRLQKREDQLESFMTQFDKNDPGYESPKGEQASVIIFTSGTTGEFKAVVLSQKNLANAVINEMNECRYQRWMLLLPLHHSLALNALITTLTAGGTLGLNLNLKYLYRDMLCFCPELVFTVPSYLKSFLHRMNKTPMRKIQEILGCRIQAVLSGGGQLDEETAKDIQAQGLKIYSSYGSTETFCIAGGCISGKAGDVGKVCSHMKTRTVDGEIMVRGITVALGYYGMKSDAFYDGWYHTGDLGYVAGDGRLYLTGRKKNLIILSNGENISPELLERRLYQIAGVKEVLVYGEDDRICAEIYTGLGDSENEAVRAKIKEMNRSLQTFYQIRRIVFRGTEFQKTALGKIRRGQDMEA